MVTTTEDLGARRRRLELFSTSGARNAHDTPMMRSPQVDHPEPTSAAIPEFHSAGGSRISLLYGDPESADDGGMSLVKVHFGPTYPLPRHSHSVDCLYYIVAGGIRMGNRTLGVGDGFFVPADVPYSYTAGPDGVELLEFRACSAFDSRLRENATGWGRILDGVRANRQSWADLSLAPA